MAHASAYSDSLSEITNNCKLSNTTNLTPYLFLASSIVL